MYWEAIIFNLMDWFNSDEQNKMSVARYYAILLSNIEELLKLPSNCLRKCLQPAGVPISLHYER